MRTNLFSVVQIGSLLTLWNLVRSSSNLWVALAGVPTEEQDREFLRSLWTIIPFPKTFLERAPKKWQDEISRFSPRLAPTGMLITLSFIGEIFEVPKADWAFVRDILQVDPDMRPAADELLQHTWPNS